MAALRMSSPSAAAASVSVGDIHMEAAAAARAGVGTPPGRAPPRTAATSFETLEARRLEELTALGLSEDEARAIALDEWHSLQNQQEGLMPEIAGPEVPRPVFSSSPATSPRAKRPRLDPAATLSPSVKTIVDSTPEQDCSMRVDTDGEEDETLQIRLPCPGTVPSLNESLGDAGSASASSCTYRAEDSATSGLFLGTDVDTFGGVDGVALALDENQEFKELLASVEIAKVSRQSSRTSFSQGSMEGGSRSSSSSRAVPSRPAISVLPPPKHPETKGDWITMKDLMFPSETTKRGAHAATRTTSFQQQAGTDTTVTPSTTTTTTTSKSSATATAAATATATPALSSSNGSEKIPSIVKQQEYAEEEEDDEDQAGSGEKGESSTSALSAFRSSRFIVAGRPHPDWLTEPAAISRLALPTLKVDDGDLRIPKTLLESGGLSSPQLETVVYAVRRFRTILPGGVRAGYYLGDGTGCGKGRIIAACCWHLWNEGQRRHLWLSASSDLLEDARRDFRDLGAGAIPLASLAAMPYGSIKHASRKGGLDKNGDGILFATYHMLVSTRGEAKGKRSQSCPENSRLAQVVEWLGGREAGGLITFDEAHKAKNLGSGDLIGASKTGIAAVELQRSCPAAACLYASATGATEIKHLGYMERLGLYGQGRPHRNFEELRLAVEKGGLAAMELVAITMRSEGMLSCRALSFRGTTFNLRMMSLQPAQIATYTTAANLWQRMLAELGKLQLAEKKRVKTQFGNRVEMRNHLDVSMQMKYFWGAQQNFFKQLVISMKVEKAVQTVEDALCRGDQVVVSMWSTGEALFEAGLLRRSSSSTFRGAELEQEDEKEMEDIAVGFSDSDAYGGALDDEDWGVGRLPKSKTKTKAKSKAATKPKAQVKPQRANSSAADGLTEFVCGLEVMIDRLLDKIFVPLARTPADKRLITELRQAAKAAKLPANLLDLLLERLGGPSKVAELTGRSRRLVSTTAGLQLQDRGGDGDSVESVNLQEQRAFQEGRKKVAIITEAASAGISLHSERRPGLSAAPRYMLTLELPWEADKAVQQLGRVHRSNQVHPPRFAVLLSELGGESRFVSSVARRLQLLGAITRGDRGAASGVSGELKSFDIQNRYGKRALDSFYRILRTHEDFPVDLDFVGPRRKFKEAEQFYKAAENALMSIGIRLTTDERFDESLKESKTLNAFLNRIMMLEPSMQNCMFGAVQALYNHEVGLDQEAGLYDEGLETLNKRCGQRVEVELSDSKVLFTHPETGAETTHLKLKIDRGFSWTCASKLFEQRAGEIRGDGFYYWKRGGVETPVLAIAQARKVSYEDDEDSVLMTLYSPRDGAISKLPGSSKRLTHEELTEHPALRRASAERDRLTLQRAWEAQFDFAGQMPVGSEESRFREEHLLGGSVLNVWGAVGSIVQDGSSGKSSERIPLIRAQPKNRKEAVVGVRVDARKLPEVQYALHALLQRTAMETQAQAEINAVVADHGSTGARIAPSVPAVDPPSYESVMECMEEHLKDRPNKCDEGWMSWVQVHAHMVNIGRADHSEQCVVAVQHWVNELIRLRVFIVDDVSGGIKVKEKAKGCGWYVPPPKPKPLPKKPAKRGKGAGRGRGRGTRGNNACNLGD